MSDLLSLLSYDPTTGVFRWRQRVSKRCLAGDEAGTVSAKGYVVIGVKGKYYKAHRLAWFFVYGVWPEGQIDHINEVKSDNRIDNLRDVTQAVNKQNTCSAQKNNGCGVRGAYYNARNKRWQAAIRVNGKLHYLGLYSTPEEAGAAYRAAKSTMHPGWVGTP